MRDLSRLKPVKQVPIYHRRLVRSGNTRTLSVGAVLPKDWTIVKMRVLKMDSRTCVLELTKLD